MSLEPVRVVAIVLGTVVLATLTAIGTVGVWQRLLVSGMFAGLLLYSGFGWAYSDMPDYYVGYYFGFLLAFGVGAWVFKVMFAPLSRVAGEMLPSALAGMGGRNGIVWNLVIPLYLLLHLVPLLHPELRLGDLIAPPSPDLSAAFAGRWEAQPRDVVLRLVDYARVLSTPLFYIALYYHRNRVWRVFLVAGVLLYIQYVDQAYIGRGTVVVMLATIWLALWAASPRQRGRLLVLACIISVLALVGSYYYTAIRIGGRVTNTSPLTAALGALESETRFPRQVGVQVIESGARVDFASYVRWLATLPIPKLITGEIPGARINYEISELVLGVEPGDKGWYVVLPGLVAESVYIYGSQFFWVHGVFIAFLGLVLVRLMERTPQLLFLKGYVVATFALNLNRAGISGPMGIIVNEFLLFYMIALAALFGRRRRLLQPYPSGASRESVS